MRLVLRHPAPFVVVLSACATCAAVFAFARPQYNRYESKTIDFSQVRYYAPAAVRSAFADHGIELRYSTRFSGITMFSDTPSFEADTLQVLVGPRTGKGNWGPKLEPYDERFGNVAVTYGGTDKRLLEQVSAAVSALRSSEA